LRFVFVVVVSLSLQGNPPINSNFHRVWDSLRQPATERKTFLDVQGQRRPQDIETPVIGVVKKLSLKKIRRSRNCGQ